jgi:hypothetical protein
LATGGGGLFQSHQQRKTGEEAEMRPKIMHVVVMGPKKAGKVKRTIGDNGDLELI